MYHQDDTPRTCAICTKPIEKFDRMMDLFRQSAPPRRVMWVHSTCAQMAIERWIIKKEEKAGLNVNPRYGDHKPNSTVGSPAESTALRDGVSGNQVGLPKPKRSRKA